MQSLDAMDIKEAETDADIARCLPAMSELRTHFKEDSSNFVQRVQQQRERGYHLVYLEDQGSIQAIAGYRIRDSLERASSRHVTTSLHPLLCQFHVCAGL